MDPLQYIHMLKYYSTIKKDKLGCTEEQHRGIHNNYAKWKKPDPKRVHTVWFHFYKILENAN